MLVALSYTRWLSRLSTSSVSDASCKFHRARPKRMSRRSGTRLMADKLLKDTEQPHSKRPRLEPAEAEMNLPLGTFASSPENNGSAGKQGDSLNAPASASDLADASVNKASVPSKVATREGRTERRNARQRVDEKKRRSLERAECEGEGESGAAAGKKAPRLPKRMTALLIGFCGSGYSGMQIQSGSLVKTIEGVLFNALVNVGAISKDNSDDPVKVSLQRAARTDAGVHAAGNVISMKMITSIPDVPDLVARINEELPPEIRLWGFQRVQNSFSARMSCDSRKYTYFFPSYLLIPPKPTSGFYRTFKQQSEDFASSSPFSTDPSAFATDSGNLPSAGSLFIHPFWENADLGANREADVVRKKRWRVDQQQMDALRAMAKRFEGTHNFHNFTVGRHPKDRSCIRHMKKIEVADPVVYGDTEWISVMLHGQSFMLHQRKMMTVMVTAVRTGTPPSIIDALYSPQIVIVPRMPSLGLLLEQPIFDSYAKRIAEANEQKGLKPEDHDYRSPIAFDTYMEKINRFKQEFIYSKMRESEETLQLFDRWQHVFDRYAGSDLLYFNTRGKIPDAAVIKPGERRANPFRERKRFDATDFTSEDVQRQAVAEEADEADAVDEADESKQMSKKELEIAED